jgi:hypothetical protein
VVVNRKNGWQKCIIGIVVCTVGEKGLIRGWFLWWEGPYKRAIPLVRRNNHPLIRPFSPKESPSYKALLTKGMAFHLLTLGGLSWIFVIRRWRFELDASNKNWCYKNTCYVEKRLTWNGGTCLDIAMRNCWKCTKYLLRTFVFFS